MPRCGVTGSTGTSAHTCVELNEASQQVLLPAGGAQRGSR